MTPSLAGCEGFGTGLRSGTLGRHREAAFSPPTDFSRSTLTHPILSEFAAYNHHVNRRSVAFHRGRVEAERNRPGNTEMILLLNHESLQKVVLLACFLSSELRKKQKDTSRSRTLWVSWSPSAPTTDATVIHTRLQQSRKCASFSLT